MELFAVFALILGLEIVLGIDNILVISILVGRLEEKDQNKARIIGLTLALLMRIGMLGVLIAITGIEKSVAFGFSVRDLVLLAGGMFLLWKAIKEIHHTVEIIETHETRPESPSGTYAAAIRDIVVLDAVFSLDSVITAIGLTDQVWIIISAVLVSFCGILVFAKPIGDFILARPSLKILALSFLITIGITLFLEGIHQHVPKAYIYLPMGFAIMVELLQMRFEHNKRIKGQKDAVEAG